MYIVIAGGGAVAEYLAMTLLKKRHEVVIIERQSEVVENLSDTLDGRYMIVQGDCVDSAVMRDAGLANADLFVVTTGRDETNFAAAEIAQVLYQVPRIIARINSPSNERIFRVLGIEGISSTTAIANMIEEEAMSENRSQITALPQGDILSYKIQIRDNTSLAAEGGRSLSDIALPSRVSVAFCGRGNEILPVDDDFVILPGDILVVNTVRDNELQVRKIFATL